MDARVVSSTRAKADWGAVRALRDAIGIPLVVNGDITSYEKAVTALEMSGADAVMVGRGAQVPALAARSDRAPPRIRDARIRAVVGGAAPAHPHTL